MMSVNAISADSLGWWVRAPTGPTGPTGHTAPTSVVSYLA
jgi:hypothetical protein